jgi:hypothetical protein
VKRHVTAEFVRNYRARVAFGFETKDLAAEFRVLAEQMLFTHGAQ